MIHLTIWQKYGKRMKKNIRTKEKDRETSQKIRKIMNEMLISKGLSDCG